MKNKQWLSNDGVFFENSQPLFHLNHCLYKILSVVVFFVMLYTSLNKAVLLQKTSKICITLHVPEFKIMTLILLLRLLSIAV